MKLRIEPKSNLSVHVQLKEQIRFLILNGDLLPGSQLPTTRQLAGFLRINRNTVLKAYQELEREGLIQCKQGRGCVVVESPLLIPQPASARLLKLVDSAIEQAARLGIEPDNFATFAYARALQRRDLHVNRPLVFIECEKPITEALARAIQERLGVPVTPLVLREVRHPSAEVEERIQEAQVIVTTFFHVQEIKALFSKSRKDVVALVVKPHLDKLIQIAEIPRGASVALVCLNETCAREMQQSLEQSGISGLETGFYGIDDKQKLAEMLPRHSVVLTSDFIAGEVTPFVREEQQLIVLDFTALDEGAISLLQGMLVSEAAEAPAAST